MSLREQASWWWGLIRFAARMIRIKHMNERQEKKDDHADHNQGPA